MKETPEATLQVSYVRAVLRLRLSFLAKQAPPDDTLANLVATRKAVDDEGAASLFDVFQLSATEKQIAWILFAVAVDSECCSIVAQLYGEPTLEFLRALVHGDSASSEGLADTCADSALRRFGIVERADGGNALVHETKQTWVISSRIVRWALGDHRIAPTLSKVLRVSAGPTTTMGLIAAEPTLLSVHQAVRAVRSVIVLSGAPGLGRRSLVAAAAGEAGFGLIEIDAKRLAKSPVDLSAQLRSIARECKLLAKAPLIRNIDALVDDKDTSKIDLVGTELVAELDTNVFVTCGVNRPQLRWDRPVIVIEVKPPSSAQRAKLWTTLLDASEGDGEYLATTYPLAPAMMHAAAAAAKARAGDRNLTPEDVELGIRAVLDDKLGHFAKRVDVTQTWNDLVIEREQAQSITELIARIRQRRTVYETWGFAAKVGKGLGVSALFSGPPGTGKTMVAALIAKELHLELYQVDMGKLVSKYIGETEKQLGELFDAAEAGHAILLFDEADSLFGKRTEVKSSNDRYANLETNYLLQRLETFTGICLLTSNHESNIDPAFQRRLSLHLRFQVPDEDEREKLWRAMLPDAAPVAPNLDFTGLARRFEMSGGYIRNAALRAAFLAADEGTEITEAHLEHAARLEYEGMGKIVAPRVPQWPSRLSSSL